MTIAIIGQACIDEIISPSGELRSRSLGGILYSYAAMERLARATDTAVLPIGYYSVPDAEYLDPLLSKLAHFDFKRLIPTQDLTNRVQLVYHTDSDRTEHCPTILPTIGLTDLKREHFQGIDGVFVNMISGFDITLEAVEVVASWSDELSFHIHLDIHALALGPLSQGEGDFGHGRRAQGLPNWKRWIATAHTVQLNELEADHIGEPDFAGQERLIDEIMRMHSEGELPRTRAIILTRAAKGASVYDLEAGTQTEVSAPSASVIDSTGSGDVFGSAFIFHLIHGNDLITYTRLATEMATWNTQLRTIEEILTN
jgi:hypothetical protein